MKIALFGVGNYTEVLIELCTDCGYKEIELFHFNTERIGDVLNNCKVVGTYDDFIANKDYNIPVAVAIGDNKIRGEWLKKLRDIGFKTSSLIHPQAFVSPSAIIGRACYIHAKAFIWTKAALGDNCIVSPNAMLAHHVSVGKNCLISANSMIGSYNRLGDNVLIGINACSISSPNIEIGNHSTVGANSLVTKSVKEYTVVIGSPAKTLIKNE